MWFVVSLFVVCCFLCIVYCFSFVVSSLVDVRRLLFVVVCFLVVVAR